MLGQKNIKAIKIIQIGESNSGKTSLSNRWAQDKFDHHQLSTVGVEYFTKEFQIDEERVKVNFWDTAGQERFRSMTPTFYRGTEGAVLVYSVTCKNSFNNITSWLSELDTYNTKHDIVKMLLANKIDIKDSRKVSREKGQNLAAQHGMLYHEVSAKTSEGTEAALKELLIKIMNTRSSCESVKEIEQNPLKETSNKLHTKKDAAFSSNCSLSCN